jgi:P-type E1-E2 ATPase
VVLTGRSKTAVDLPATGPGLECLVFIDGRYAAVFRFRDRPRCDSTAFVSHIKPKDHAQKVILLSGDRESEVRYLAETIGISEVHAGKTPEEKVAIVKEETLHAKTLYVGDGINDAPAMLAATAGVAFGQNSDITNEAADVVLLEPSLAKIDESMHIGRHMRKIALQSAVGGMALSLIERSPPRWASCRQWCGRLRRNRPGSGAECAQGSHPAGREDRHLDLA